MRGSRRQARHAPAHLRRAGDDGRSVGRPVGRGAEDWGFPTQTAGPASGGPDRAVGTVAALGLGLAVDDGARQGSDPHQGPDPMHGYPAAPPPHPAAGHEDGGRREAAEPLRSGRAVLRGVTKRNRTLVAGGATLRLLVLASTDEDTIAVDLASGAVLRLRIPWPEGHEPDLSPFDVVEATLADDPERDDLAQPEAATAASLPRHVGSLRGRRVRHLLNRLAVSPDGPLLGFLGPSAPYWEFRGFRPSVALIRPARGPQLIRRPADGSTWVRFGIQRDDVWLPVEDQRTCRALDASRRERLHGKALTTALGFAPHYLLVAVSSPRDGHCYKICVAVLPKD